MFTWNPGFSLSYLPKTPAMGVPMTLARLVPETGFEAGSWILGHFSLKGDR